MTKEAKADFEYAIGQLNNYPPEHRTPALILCLMRNSDARSALSELLGVSMSGGEAKTMKEPKQVTDTSERNMVGRKVRVALDGPRGRDGATITINGWVTGQYVEEGDTEDTTIFILSVSGPILGV